MPHQLPEHQLATMVSFIQQTFSQQHCTQAVIAVSGGIDSAVALTVVTRALGPTAIWPLLLPYGEQDMSDARTLCEFNQIPEAQWQTLDVQPIVDLICSTRAIDTNDLVRRGNVMARVRMILVFDRAREKSALVCGTENKSEHYLGYFTRFGDAASDIEPVSQLYKTQVRELATQLGIPDQILTKPPSAGLWAEQTDEQELGFSYDEADQVLQALIDGGVPASSIVIPGLSAETIAAVCARVEQQAFKRVVPYTME